MEIEKLKEANIEAEELLKQLNKTRKACMEFANENVTFLKPISKIEQQIVELLELIREPLNTLSAKDVNYLFEEISTPNPDIKTVKEVINFLETIFNKNIPLEDVWRECEIKGLTKERTNEIIEKFRKSGDLYIPKQGFICKIE